MTEILVKLEKIQNLIKKNPENYKEKDLNVIYTWLEQSDYETVINKIRKNDVPCEDDDVPEKTATYTDSPSPIIAKRTARNKVHGDLSDSEEDVIIEGSFCGSGLDDSSFNESLNDSNINRKRKRSPEFTPSPQQTMQRNQSSDDLLSTLMSIFPNEKPSYLKHFMKENPGVSSDNLVTIILDAKSRFKKNGGIGKKSSSTRKPAKKHSIIELSDTDDEEVVQAAYQILNGIDNKSTDKRPKEDNQQTPTTSHPQSTRQRTDKTVDPVLTPESGSVRPPAKRKPPDPERPPVFKLGNSDSVPKPTFAPNTKGDSENSRVPELKGVKTMDNNQNKVAGNSAAASLPRPSVGFQNSTPAFKKTAENCVPGTSSGAVSQEKKTEEDLANVTIDLSLGTDSTSVKAQNDNEDTTLSHLLNIFPDVDPSFLEKKAGEIGEDSERLQEFVLNNVGTSNLPSRKEYDKKMARKNEIDKIKDLKVQDFLRECENPSEIFYDSKSPVSESYKKCCLNYLEKKFSHVAKRTFDRILKKHNYHLLPSIKDLEKVKSRSRNARAYDASTAITYETLDITFFKEYVFYKLEPKIKKAMADNEQSRQQKIEEARENGALFTCQCCFDEECLLGEECTCVQEHMFCSDCVRRGAEVQIGDNKTKIICFQQDCGQEIELAVLSRVLRPKIYQRLAERRAAEEVLNANVPDLVQCPACNFAVSIPESVKLINCENPECGKVSCRECKEENHLPLRCEEYEKQDEVKARTKLENAMAEAMIRECPKCKNRFLKSDGCNKMKCQCGTVTCYLCKKVIPDNYNHFYGHGATPIDGKCPLWSDNDSLHKDEVAKAAEATKKELDASKLKHDPTVGIEKPPEGFDRNRQYNQFAERVVVQHPYAAPRVRMHWMNPLHHGAMPMGLAPAAPPHHRHHQNPHVMPRLAAPQAAVAPMPAPPMPHFFAGGMMDHFGFPGGRQFDRRFNRNMGNFGMDGRIMDYVQEDMNWLGGLHHNQNNRLH